MQLPTASFCRGDRALGELGKLNEFFSDVEMVNGMVEHPYPDNTWPLDFPFLCESPLEEAFAESIVKYLPRERPLLSPQVWVDTPVGKFRLDFLITTSGKRTAFECDGKDFHDVARDRWRDAVILGHDQVDTIYRLRGTDVWNNVENLLYSISLIQPDLFSERGRVNLETLASTSVGCDPSGWVPSWVRYGVRSFNFKMDEFRLQPMPKMKMFLRSKAPEAE